MDPDPPQEAGEPEVTVETVPDNIETGAGASTGLGLLDRLWYSLLAYFSNPWPSSFSYSSSTNSTDISDPFLLSLLQKGKKVNILN